MTFMKSDILRAVPILIIAATVLLPGCFEDGGEEYPDITRYDKIPADSVKVTPETDVHPPILHSDEFEEPVPMPGLVNTRGGEDSPFILPDGNTFYFFFTPDVSVPAEKQVIDDVTGIYGSRRGNGTWTEPKRVWLQDPGKLALDGAHTIVGDTMWFASAREGYTGLHWFTADRVDGEWENWQYAGDRLIELEVGELHFVGDDLYFHSGREGGKGQYDIWTMKRIGDDWSTPVNIEEVNTAENEGWPYLTPDGREMWFTRTYMGTPSIWRSFNINGVWQEPVLILEMFAGEPSLDEDGNLYFVHHFFENDIMIEADIYVCYRK
ncbi:MAG: PD40 domain-containing protein [Candidatus Thermoplasmatota archaeon]|nr:PD40 domain-containing protein [Candidatus Thermoplasmatota archaeon]